MHLPLQNYEPKQKQHQKSLESDTFITAWYEPTISFGDLPLDRKLQEKLVC